MPLILHAVREAAIMIYLNFGKEALCRLKRGYGENDGILRMEGALGAFVSRCQGDARGA